VGAALSRKFLIFLGAELLAASMIFLAVFVGIYRGELEAERAQVSAQMNQLLQASLENAMLKRDLDGLKTIVERLGQQDNVAGVVIVNPEGEVRFASTPSWLGRRLDPGPGGFVLGTQFLAEEDGEEILRSVNPVRNKEPCTQCHGPVETHPVNGVLVVDYDAGTLRETAKRTALTLILFGLVVVLAMLGGVWWMLKRHVLAPVETLAVASRALASGDFDFRAGLKGKDELGQLGRSFDTMADVLKAAVAKERVHEAFLQELIDSDPDAIRVLSQDGKILKANSAYRRLLGLSPEEDVRGLLCHVSSHGLANFCPATLVTCPLVEIKANREPLKAVQRMKRRDGSEIDVEVHAAPLIGQEGELLVVESIRDLAADIRFSHEQKLSELGRLATGVAHEIRNPLASVRLALQGLLKRAEGGSMTAEEAVRYLMLVDGQIDKCIDVTDRLLKLSMHAGGRPQLLSVKPAIEETVSLLSYEAEAKQIDVVIDLPSEETCRVMASDSDLRMIVLNLVQNAFHALPLGGRLDIQGQARDAMFEIVFSDNGAGIPEDALPRIFDPFFSRRADGQPGTGLGLTIVKSLAKRLGGGVSVESKEGLGTRFILRLPRAGGGNENMSLS
jgi:PAS domain S-box-containing protein